MEMTPKPGEFYRHFKDKLYQIVTVAEHTETGEALVVYQALYGDFKTYARPLSMFLSEVDRRKYPQVTQKYRFENVTLQVRRETARDQETAWDQETAQSQNAAWNQGAAQSQNAAQRGLSPDPAAPSSEPLNSNLLAFIEADTYGERMECLCRMRGKVCQEDLDIIYVALDLGRPAGTLEEQLYAVEQCLKMQQHYDGGRLR